MRGLKGYHRVQNKTGSSLFCVRNLFGIMGVLCFISPEEVIPLK